MKMKFTVTFRYMPVFPNTDTVFAEVICSNFAWLWSWEQHLSLYPWGISGKVWTASDDRQVC